MSFPPDGAEAFGEWITSLRTQLGLTQQEVAAAALTTTRTIQRWEAGENEKGVEVARVLTALGVKMSPPAPKDVRALNSLTQEIRAGLDHVDRILREEREAEATEQASLHGRLEEISGLVDDGIARLEADIARVERRLERGGGQAQGVET